MSLQKFYKLAVIHGLMTPTCLAMLAPAAHATSAFTPDFFVSVQCLAEGAIGNSFYVNGTTPQSTGCSGPDGSQAGGEASAGHLSAEADNGEATAIYEDDYTVAGPPALNGAAGSLMMAFHVDGFSIGANTTGNIHLTYGGDNDQVSAFSLHVDGVQSADQVVYGDVSFIFGVPYDKQVVLEVDADGGEIGFFHTAELVGLTAYDADGNPVDATVTGNSGIDYEALAAANAESLGLTGPTGPSAPPTGLPEPLSLALFLPGLLGLARLKHLRR